MSASVSSQENLGSVQPTVKGAVSRQASTSSDMVCWVEVRQYQYQPDHQVELLHLQAEADALLLQLQAVQQRRHAGSKVDI